jgi:hypothetical protein
MGVLNTLLKASIVVSVAIATLGVGYYFAIYVPKKDAAQDAERSAEVLRLNRSRAEQEPGTEDERAAAAQKKLRISSRYEACVRDAELSYRYNATDKCRHIVEERRKMFDDCTRTLPQPTCEAIHGTFNQSDNCALPTNLAKSLDDELEKSKNRCLQEFQLGLQ